MAKEKCSKCGDMISGTGSIDLPRKDEKKYPDKKQIDKADKPGYTKNKKEKK